MRAAALILILLALLCTFFVVWQTDSDNIKAVVAGDDFDKPGHRSLMEDISYWCWPAKWQEYQDARYEAAQERIRNMTPEQVKAQTIFLEQLNQANKEHK